MEKVTDMFRHTFPYTTIYPSLGNLDITSSSMLSNRFPKPSSPYHRARRPHGQGSNRNGHRRRGKKGNFVYKTYKKKHISIYLMRFQIIHRRYKEIFTIYYLFKSVLLIMFRRLDF